MRVAARLNSTMVRLKDRSVTAVHGERPKFQFHYGTIKRYMGALNIREESKFQFHYGTIKRHADRKGRSRSFVSIPLWYD